MSDPKFTIVTGPAAAAFLAAGVGCLAIGAMTALSEASAQIKQSLDWYQPSGPLTGKVFSSLAIWLFTWAGLHFTWRQRDIDLKIAVTVTLVLIAIAFLATFPPIFQLAEG
jgi:hypothetical protein